MTHFVSTRLSQCLNDHNLQDLRPLQIDNKGSVVPWVPYHACFIIVTIEPFPLLHFAHFPTLHAILVHHETSERA